MFHWYRAIPSSGPHRTVGVVFRRDRSIDFPRVSSRCPRLNEVTDFQWPAAAWMTGALLANSTLNLHSSVIKRATTFETRVLSSNREERRVLSARAFAPGVRFKSSGYNHYRNKRVYACPVFSILIRGYITRVRLLLFRCASIWIFDIRIIVILFEQLRSNAWPNRTRAALFIEPIQYVY